MLRDSATTQDEGFREIQLTGKQLVFLFMATTVVSIVIFLCGVLVGRGVRGDVMVAERSTSTVSPSEPPASDPEPVDETVTSEDVKNPTALPPELSYQQRLDGSGAAAPIKPAPPAPQLPTAAAPAAPPAATEKAAANTAAPVATPASRPQPAPSTPVNPPNAPAAAARTAPAATVPAPTVPASKAPVVASVAPGSAAASKPAPQSAADSGGGGQFVVQVAALADRTEADQVAQKLSAKGYAAFVLEPASNTKDKFYRVRIGRFADRPTAERTMKQLAQEGPYKPWITR